MITWRQRTINCAKQKLKRSMYLLWQGVFGIILLAMPYSWAFVLHGIMMAVVSMTAAETFCARKKITDANTVRSVHRLVGDCAMLVANHVVFGACEAAKFNLQTYAAISVLDWLLMANAPWQKELLIVCHHSATLAIMLFAIASSEFEIAVDILCMFTWASLPINLRPILKSLHAPAWAITANDIVLVGVWFLYRIPNMFAFTHVIFCVKLLPWAGSLMLVLVSLHIFWSFEILKQLHLKIKAH